MREDVNHHDQECLLSADAAKLQQRQPDVSYKRERMINALVIIRGSYDEFLAVAKTGSRFLQNISVGLLGGLAMTLHVQMTKRFSVVRVPAVADFDSPEFVDRIVEEEELGLDHVFACNRSDVF